MFKKRKTKSKKRRFFKHIKPAAWVGSSEIVTHGKFLKSLIYFPNNTKSLNSSSRRSLSFDEMVDENNLSPDDLQAIAARSFKLAIFFLIASAFVFLYAALLFHRDLLLASFCTTSFSLLFFSYFLNECCSYARVKLRKLSVNLLESVVCFFNRGIK